MIPKQVFAIEGLDRLGKSTLIQGIQDVFGYYQVIHFSKPQKLEIYNFAAKKEYFEGDGPIKDVPQEFRSAYYYQSEGFRNSMLLAKSGARIIFDRWHIGEAVYSPMYRKYSGSYVFEQELATGMHEHPSLRLILLVEDFGRSHHFNDDGNSLGPARNRREEQKRFMDAFYRSHIRDKKIVCVTANDGNFRNKDDILEEAVS